MMYKEWHNILSNAINGDVSNYDMSKMIDDSYDWKTCAVGAKLMCDLNRNILRSTHKNLLTEKIVTAGNVFTIFIYNRRFSSALQILEEIYHTENIYKSKFGKLKSRLKEFTTR